MEAQSTGCEFACDLLSLATETLLDIVSYLTAYERLCLRITCKRFYSILSDPRAWHTLVWRDCRKRDSDYKALRLALKLSASTVQSISILCPKKQIIFSFLFGIYDCKQVRYLTLSGKLHNTSMLAVLLSELPSLYYLSITVEGDDSRSILPVCARAKNLKILKIVTVDLTDYRQGVLEWQALGYFPPNLQVINMIGFAGWHFSEYFLYKLSKSDHPAKLTYFPKCSSAAGNLVDNYPLLEVTLYPKVEIAFCFVRLSNAWPRLALCNGKTCASSEESCEYTSATYLREYPDRLSSQEPLPSLPPSIQSLCLKGMEFTLRFTDLSSISECCPNLRCLNICGCWAALSDLSGLADIGEKCLQLTSLNIKFISDSESVPTLWAILAGMKKLRHLAMDEPLLSPSPPLDEQSLSHVRNSIRKITLSAFEIDCISNHFRFDILFPAFHRLSHLRISGTIPGLDSFLPYIPNLTYLALHNNRWGEPMKGETNPLCYSSLKQIYITQLDVSEDFFQALTHSRSLTHLYIQHSFPLHGPFAEREISQTLKPWVSVQFEDFPSLCVLCAYVVQMRLKIMPKADVNDVLLLRQLNSSLDDRGICGFLKERDNSDPSLDEDYDVRSLWPEF